MKLLALTIKGEEIDCPPGVPCGGEAGMLDNILRVGIQLLFILATLLALIYLIYGGLDWIMSRGEKEKINNAKRKITFSIIGLVIVFISFLIVQIVSSMFGVNSILGPAG
jgi:hypothetical protein